jgi:hypothetical protein
MCTQYLNHIHLLIPLPHLLPLPLVSTPPLTPDRACSFLLFSDFAKERKKKWHFCLFKIATQGVSLWYFHVYMYYNLIWFISSIFLLSTLVLFLLVVLTCLKFLHSFLYRECINHIHLNFLLLPSSSTVWPLLSVSCW